GVVYEAEQVSLRRRVALKILPPAAALDPRNHQRFLLEARAAACLHHAHIVPVYAVGSERGVPYYAMQFIDGRTLAQVLGQLRGRGDGAGAGEATTAPAPPPVWARESRVGPTARSATRPGPSHDSSIRDRSYIRTAADHARRAAEALDHAHGRGVLHRDI